MEPFQDDQDPQLITRETKSGSSWIAWVVGIVLVILVGGGLYYYYQYIKIPELNKRIDNLQQQVDQLNKDQESSTDETAGWKTYTNSDYGVNFKYPKDWTTQNLQLGSALISLGLNSAGYTPKRDTDQPNSANFYLYKSISKLDNKKLNPNALKDYLDKYSALADPVYKNVESQKIGSLDGYSADAGPNQFGGGKYYFLELSNRQIVEFWLFNTATNSETMDKILSTFQFTD